MRLARGNEPELHPQGVSRRTFLFLGASAAVSLALPTPTLPEPFERIVLDAFDRRLYARIVFTGPEMVIMGRRGGKTASAWQAARRAEMRGILNDYRAARMANLRIKWANRPRVPAGVLRSPLFADTPRITEGAVLHVSEPSTHLPE